MSSPIKLFPSPSQIATFVLNASWKFSTVKWYSIKFCSHNVHHSWSFASGSIMAEARRNPGENEWHSFKIFLVFDDKDTFLRFYILLSRTEISNTGWLLKIDILTFWKICTVHAAHKMHYNSMHILNILTFHIIKYPLMKILVISSFTTYTSKSLRPDNE